MADENFDTEVLIAGAGPTGLVLALWLRRLGARIRILDKANEPGTTSRALAVQARTLEFYGQLGFADEVVSQGGGQSAERSGAKGDGRLTSTSRRWGQESAPTRMR